MKANKILVLALASLMLVVACVGSASATTYYTYQGTMGTKFDGSNVNLLSDSSGNYNVHVNDYLDWGNTLWNTYSGSVGAWGDYLNSDLYSSNPWYNNPTVLTPGQHITTPIYMYAQVTQATSDSINAYHVYTYTPNIYYSPYNSDMSFTSS